MLFRCWPMRSIQCIIATVLYSAVFTWYVYAIPDPQYPMNFIKAFFNGFTAVTFLFYFIDRSRGYESFWHKQFNSLVFFCPIINYFFITLYYLNFIADPFIIFLCSNGAIIVTSLFLIYSGGRHGTFNND